MIAQPFRLHFWCAKFLLRMCVGDALYALVSTFACRMPHCACCYLDSYAPPVLFFLCQPGWANRSTIMATGIVGLGVDAVDYDAAFRRASAEGRVDVVRALLALAPERGVDPSMEDNYALRVASEHGHILVVQMLLALPLGSGLVHIQPSSWKVGNCDGVTVCLPEGFKA